MLRPFATATACVLLVLAARAGDPAKVKEFAADLDKLNGSWASAKKELGPGVTGQLLLKLEFKKDNAVGHATLRYFRDGVFANLGPCLAEVKAKDEKRFIVLAEMRKGERVELGEIAYEVSGDKLKLTSPKGLRIDQAKKPIEVSGEWQRIKAVKK